MTTREPGASEVLTHGCDRQAALDRLLGEQPGGEHHRRVRGVGAARDGGDHDVPVVELGHRAVGERRPRWARGRGPAARGRTACRSPAPRRCRRWGRSPPAGRWPGTTRRRPRRGRRRSAGASGPGSGTDTAAGQQAWRATTRTDAGASASATRSWGRAGPARLGSTVDEVELEALGEDGLAGRVVPQPLLLGVGLDQRDLLGRRDR